MAFDLLIKGGRVIDPAQGVDGIFDVAVRGSQIEAVSKDIDPSNAKNCLDASGKLITSGLIDLHNHVYHTGIPSLCVPADEVGVKAGVTTLVDAGSAGAATFEGFASVLGAAVTDVSCFLNILSGGLGAIETVDWAEIDLDKTVAVSKEHSELILGIKVLLMGPLVQREGIEVFMAARKAATKAGIRLMVHIGDRHGPDPWELTAQVLPLMEKGDILSHIFTANPGRVVTRSGSVLPEFLAATRRGVALDVAHGSQHFCFETAQRALEQGIMPTAISTDLSQLTLQGPVWSLTETMSKFLMLGLSITDVVRMTTINPARALGMEGRIGSLKQGMAADVSILGLQEGARDFIDSAGETRRGEAVLVPVTTVKSGRLVTCPQ